MLNKNERMEKLNQAGINTGKYFSIDLPNGLKPGAKISLVINENGEPVLMKEDNIVNQIISDGYVRNTKLHRRFVMAQMFPMLNYKSYYGQEPGYNTCLRERYAYDYTLTMMLEEVRVLSKLEARDKESFEERSHFFTKAAIIAVLEDYVEKVKEHVDNLPNHKCKGVPYKRINRMNIFNEDIFKRVYKPIVHDICRIKFANSYSEIYKILNKMMRNRVKLPWNTPKSKAWIDAYKGEGSFYCMKNLLMYHNCYVETENYIKLYGVEAVSFITDKLDEYHSEGWRMFALMKKVIKDNEFNFNERMNQIYNGQD